MSYFVPVDEFVGGSIFTSLSVTLPGYTTPQTLVVPAVGASVFVYLRDTTTEAPVYADEDGTGATSAQPLTTDADGHVVDSLGQRVYCSQPQRVTVHISGTGLVPRDIAAGRGQDLATIADPHVVGSDAAMLAIAGAHEGTVAIRTDLNRAAFINNGGATGTDADWVELAFGDVESINGHVGVVVLAAADVGAAPVGAPLAGLSTTSASASGNLTAGTIEQADATAGTIARALPSTGTVGQVIEVEKQDATANLVNVTGKIRGVAASTLALKLQFESVVFVYEGGGSWHPFSGHKSLSSLDARYATPAYADAGTAAEAVRAGAAELAARRDRDLTLLQSGLAPFAAQFSRNVYAGVPGDAPHDAGRVTRIVVQADNAPTFGPFNGIGYAAALKAIDPSVQVFAYIDPLRFKTSDTLGITVVPGVPDTEILHDSRGVEFTNNVLFGVSPDPGNTSYQSRLNSHLDVMKGWFAAGLLDGFYFDDVTPTLLFLLPSVTHTGCTTTNGSFAVSDTTVAAADEGSHVTGGGIPLTPNPGTFIRNVTPGVGFELSSTSSGAVVHVNAGAGAGAGVTLTVQANCPAYPDDASFQTAMIAMLTSAASHLRSSGGRVDTATVTSGKVWVYDSQISLADRGKPIASSAAIPAGTYVGYVIPGFACRLSSSPTSQVDVAATASASSITVGLLLIGNTNVGSYGASVWESLVTPMDGAMIQNFANDGSGSPAGRAFQFAANLAQLVWAEANNRLAICQSVDTTEANQTFALAQMLLAAGGRCTLDLSTISFTGNNSDMYFPVYDLARQLGQPLGPYSLSGGLYSRSFEYGNVKVNPTAGTISGVPAYTGQITITGAAVPVAQNGWVAKNAGQLPYTMAATDRGVKATGAGTVNLPATPTPGLPYKVKNMIAAGGRVVVSTGTTGKIDNGGSVNATSVNIDTLSEELTFEVDTNGSDWLLA